VPSRARSSDGRGALIVLEGMPGAGKTSAASVLERRGHQVVGEYLAERPGVDDDSAHQRNWIAKTTITVRAARSGRVFCDRDFLTSLAFACSIADGELIARRTAWALTHLGAGRLMVGDVYLVLDITPGLSLARRAGQLSSEHPWSRPAELERLHRFYRAPLEVLARMDSDLEAAFAGARWCSVSGEETTPEQVAGLAARLADEAGQWPP
jgi:thymidylate kinase